MELIGLAILAWAWLGPIVAIFVSGHPVWAIVIAILTLLGLRYIRSWGCIVWAVWLVWGIIATYLVGGGLAISIIVCWVLLIIL